MLAPGDNIESYTLLARVGAGGQASVWQARDARTGQLVALKLVSLAGDASSDERAAREASVLASVVHPSLVRCLRAFDHAPRRLLVLVLEWVEGTTLGRASADPRWSPLHLHAALVHVAGALARLHEVGVVHRDVKGANVLVAASFFERPLDPSSVKLADLGIAAGVGNPAALTNVGFVVGTTAYLPPESLRARAHQVARPSRDVFAFGVMGWLLKHGVHPTGLPSDATLDELADAYAAYTGAEQLWLPYGAGDDGLERVLRRCLRLDAEARPPDGASLLAALPPLPQQPVSKTLPGVDETLRQLPARPLPVRSPPGPSARSGRGPMRPVAVAVAGVLVAGVAVGGIAWWRGAEASSLGSSVDEGASASAARRKRDKQLETEELEAEESEREADVKVSATSPGTADGVVRRGPSCAPRWPNPPSVDELDALEHEARPLDRALFHELACETEVSGSDSHCAITHRAGRWLRLRFALRAGTELRATWRGGGAPPAMLAEPWSGGVDLYVALPPRRLRLGVSAPGAWAGEHALVLDPTALKPLAFVERGACGP